MELTLFVDHQCNLRCTYCYNGDKFSRRMSIEVVRDAIRLALGSARDGLDVSFFGGEPLLHPAFLAEADAVPRQNFDLAFTNGVFHHIPPDQRTEAVRLVFESLKPGGVFAFWENNRWNPAVHWVMSRVPFDQDAQMLFPHQARRLLRQAGLKVLRTDHLFFFPARLAALRPLERWLRRVPLGGQYLVLAQKPLV